MHNRTENDRSDHHFDELNESVAQRLQGRTRCRIKMADKHSCNDSDQDLDV
jgi:hypothetical protein